MEYLDSDGVVGASFDSGVIRYNGYKLALNQTNAGDHAA